MYNRGMKMKSGVEACLNCSKLAAVLVSLVWLFFVTRYLEIKPEYATREYLRLFQDNGKNNGIVRMSSVSLPNLRSPHHPLPPHPQKSAQQFHFFKFLQLIQSKTRLKCENELQVLVINANYKSVGDTYLSLYKEIERQSPYCRHAIYQLNRREHLLMNSDILLTHYGMEVALGVEMLLQGKGPVDEGNGNTDTSDNENDIRIPNTPKSRKLMILTFQQGSIILLKALQYLSPQTISQLGSVILLNTFNPNLQILNEPSYRYVHRIQKNLQPDGQKMAVLNQTQLIFISTTNYYDQTIHDEEWENRFMFLFSVSKDDGKEYRKLYNSVFLSTRFMKNIHVLMHERDYFLFGALAARIGKFMLLDPAYVRNVRAVQYFFNYGELSVRVDPQFSSVKKKYCHNSLLSNLNKVTKIISTPCLIINLLTKMKQKMVQNCTALLVSSKKSYIFNHKFQRIETTFETNENNYYIFEKLATTNELTIINPNRTQNVLVQFQKPNGPATNPLPPEIVLSSGPNIFLNTSYKDHMEHHKIIRVCPEGNPLIFPQNFYNVYPDSSLLTSLIIYTLNNIGVELRGIGIGGAGEERENLEADCYVDSTHVRVMPGVWVFDWWRERNILGLVIVFGGVRRESVFGSFYFYLVLLLALRYYLNLEPMVVQNILLLSIAITLQKCLQLILHLVKFIQELLDLKYRKLLLALTLALSLLKLLNESLAELAQISAWKMLFISLIFVLNRENAYVLLIKIYYLIDLILYNHGDVFEVGLLVGWIWVSLGDEEDGEEVREREGRDGRTFADRKEKIIGELSTSMWKYGNQRPPSVLDTLLVVFFIFLVEGPSHLHNTVITCYIILKLIAKSWHKIKQ